MAYNNGFPMNYQPMYYPTQANAYPMQSSVGATQPTQNGIIWVQGEAGAKSYLVAPNTTIQLWDSENNVIYLKSADSSGMPSIKILDYTIRENAPQNGLKSFRNDSEFVTKDEFDSFKSEVKKMLEKEKLTDGELPF